MRTSASILSLHSVIAILPGSTLLFYETGGAACPAPRRLNLLACCQRLSPAAKPYRDLVRAVLRACIANPIGVRAFATRANLIGVETAVRHSGDQHAVTVNVDAAGSRPGRREVHCMPPLYLVAIRTERDLPRHRGRHGSCSRCRCGLRRLTRGNARTKQQAQANEKGRP